MQQTLQLELPTVARSLSEKNRFLGRLSLTTPAACNGDLLHSQVLAPSTPQRVLASTSHAVSNASASANASANASARVGAATETTVASIYVDGRKVEDPFEHPFAVRLLCIIVPALPVLHARGWTPNMVTTVSLITGLGSVLCACWQLPGWCAALFLSSYFFDCMDGPLARRYNQVTAFGDKYDHFKDVLITVSVLTCIHLYYPMAWWFWLLLAFLSLSAALHAGLVEAYNDVRSAQAGLSGALANSPANVLQHCRIVSQLCEPSCTESYATRLCTLRAAMAWSRYGGDASLVLAVAVHLLCQPRGI